MFSRERCHGPTLVKRLISRANIDVSPELDVREGAACGSHHPGSSAATRAATHSAMVFTMASAERLRSAKVNQLLPPDERGVAVERIERLCGESR
jgi:hypothetical protein